MNPSNETGARNSLLGITAVVLGIYLAAHHGIELMKQYTFATPPTAEAQAKAFRCPPYELREESISVQECQQMAAMLQAQLIARPPWFRAFESAFEAAAVVLALLTSFVGLALIDGRSWAAVAASAVFGAFAAMNIGHFLVISNTGPLMRQTYLWTDSLWVLIHTALTVATVAGSRKLVR